MSLSLSTDSIIWASTMFSMGAILIYITEALKNFQPGRIFFGHIILFWRCDRGVFSFILAYS